MPLHPSIRQQGNSALDNSTSACNIEQDKMLCLHASTAKMNTIGAHLHSSAQMKDIHIPHRSSSSSPSASSDEPLKPVPINYKRWRFPRHPLSATVPHRYRKNNGPLSPASFNSDQVDETSSSSAAAGASKLCMQQILSSAKCASIDNQQSDPMDSNPFISSKRRRTVDLHCEDAPTVTGDVIDVDKEDERKLIMWRAACAMAHAYLHRNDQHQNVLLHQHDLHQHHLYQRNQHELIFHIPRSRHLICDVALNDDSLQVSGPLLQEACESQRVTEQINKSLPSSSSPPPNSSKDGVCTPSSTCLLSDVVCIDEVVNPTQAAEWFGALFSSTSTLVS